eukprot:m.40790 g.40790  ORF g.40790 m.40790 type:complete len:315 (-) comp6947_c0_seq1:434-1378(-)
MLSTRGSVQRTTQALLERLTPQVCVHFLWQLPCTNHGCTNLITFQPGQDVSMLRKASSLTCANVDSSRKCTINYGSANKTAKEVEHENNCNRAETTSSYGFSLNDPLMSDTDASDAENDKTDRNTTLVSDVEENDWNADAEKSETALRLDKKHRQRHRGCKEPRAPETLQGGKRKHAHDTSDNENVEDEESELNLAVGGMMRRKREKRSTALNDTCEDEEDGDSIASSTASSQPQTPIKSSYSYVPDDIVVVTSSKASYPAKVMKVDKRRHRCFIHYEGLSSQWDEWKSMDAMLPILAEHISRTRRSPRRRMFQ